MKALRSVIGSMPYDLNKNNRYNLYNTIEGLCKQAYNQIPTKQNTVFVLEHALYKDDNKDNDIEDFKLIGVFATEQQAQAAINQLKSQPGFKEYPNGFHIDAYPLNQINWSSGFGCN